jgi:hypothetical protein
MSRRGHLSVYPSTEESSMKTHLVLATLLLATLSVPSYAQYQAPTKGLSKDYEVSWNKTDQDNCPLISVRNTGTKPYRLTIRYTHSGTTLGRSPSSETRTLSWGNFRAGESKDFEIDPGANCGRPNRLTIDEVRAELY